MFDLITTNPYPLFVTALAFALFTAYRAGEMATALVLTPQVCVRPHERPQVDLYAHIPIDVDWEFERLHPEIGANMDMTVTLDTIGPRETQDSVTIQDLRDRIIRLEDDVLTANLSRDVWRVRAERADKLRSRYLRLLRGERARLAFWQGDVMNAPRRPAKAKLAAVVLELPRGRHLHLVPPLVANEWRAA